MAKRIGLNREKLKAFVFRRKANLMGLVAIALIGLAATVALALAGSPRTGVAAVVSALLILLCAVQIYRMKSSYRTIPSFRGARKRRKRAQEP